MADDIILMLPKAHWEALDARAVDDPTVFDRENFGNFMGSGPGTYVRSAVFPRVTISSTPRVSQTGSGWRMTLPR